MFPHIEHSMASLLIAQASTGTTALVQAMLLGRGGAIRAYHAMLIDARVLPYTIHSLSRLLNAERPDGKSGLAASLDKGNADAIKAFHELLADPLLAPHIARLKILPKLLAAKRRDGTPGVLLALRNNHPSAVEAFGDMLEDPLILPLIRHDMAKLVVSRDASGLPASSWGIWPEQSPAIVAFRAMLTRPEIAAVLGARNATQTSAIGATSVAATAMDSRVPTTVGGSLALLAQRIIRGAAQWLAGPWHRTP